MTKDFELLDQFQRSDSLCCPSPQNRLVTALEERNFNEFAEILTDGVRTKRVDINYIYEDPRNGTLLDIACSSAHNCQFVSILIKYGANINTINKFYKKAPLHTVVERSDLPTLTILVEHKSIDINVLDSYGNTALHLASKLNKIDFIKLLLEHPSIHINKSNRKGQTPLHLALSQSNKEAVTALLDRIDIDLDGQKNFAGQTCREMLRDKFPDLEMETRKKGGAFVTANKNLFELLYTHDVRSFITLAKSNKDRLNDNDGHQTYMQYICKFGLIELIEPLLEFGVDPNLTCSTNCCSPIMIAADRGYYNIVRKLVKNADIPFEPIGGETVLHAVLNGFTQCQSILGASDEDRNHFKCLEFLLNNVPNDKLDINHPDTNGNTVLHYAAKINDAEMIKLLLDKGAYVGHKNNFGNIPLTSIRAKILENYLDECVTTNEKQSREDSYEIIYKYDFLAPPKICPHPSEPSKFPTESGTVEDYEVVSETAPLVAMSGVPELRPLLKHPVFASFLNLKWYTIRKYFYVNLSLYVTFWLLLTFYILNIYGPSSVGQTDANVVENLGPTSGSRQGRVLWFLTAILCGAVALRELFQFNVSPFRYLTSFENWLEIGLITVTTMILCQTATDMRSQIAAVAILLSWTELVLLIGRHPLLSTNVEMFKVVCWNFLKFLAWYSILILAFALSFYMLFKDRSRTKEDGAADDFFQDPVISIFKSVIMLTGEFDAASIPFGVHPGTSHILFVLFVFLIAIVLFNLLNGLAVSDTAAIKSDAELVSFVCRAKLIMYIETMAISDPFPCLNVLEKLSCLCCCVPVRRVSASRRKNVAIFYKRINLFPNLLPGREARVLPNQENRVMLPNPRLQNKRQDSSDPRCFDNCTEWFIDSAIVKASKQILELKSTEDALNSSADGELIRAYSRQLKECDNKLRILQESTQRTERAVVQIMSLLKGKL